MDDASTGAHPITRVLIANRGEIAVRVAQTCHALGIEVVAVHSDADADADHVRIADIAVPIGPAPARDSYLDTDKVLAAAKATGADAIHPGYGFLSENAAFAQAVTDAGLIFIGPSPDAMRLMGDKAAAKRAMIAAGVPVVPGIDDDTLTDEELIPLATEVGVPLLVKAVAGGGGKGMRPVHEIADLPEAIAAARREAMAAFGDDRLIVEKLIQRPRHIEIQVVGDQHGNVVHLFERECSIQRRHQKIVEESPAAHFDPDLRQQMADAAVAAAKAVDYVGAGTVEFILGEDGTFAFLEMNTRLQVEHPVTELVTGVDLVAWQLDVAAGRPLPAQDTLTSTGHAIEVRLYAEDPANEFLPAVGHLSLFDIPAGPGIRVDSGVSTGAEVSRHYDPMLAKLIVFGPDRDVAVSRLQSMLRRARVLGVQTNLDHLAAVAATPAFMAGDLHTGFLDEHLPDWTPATLDDGQIAAVAAVIAAPDASDASVFTSLGPWRTTGSPGWTVHLRDRDHDHLASVAATSLGLVVDDATATVTRQADATHVQRGDRTTTVTMSTNGDRHWVHLDGEIAATRVLTLVPPTRHADASELAGGAAFVSPMPGAVIAVNVAAGDVVTAGQPLVVVEAMKMEHPITAPADGTIVDVFVRAGDAVDAGQDLLAFEAADTGADG